MIVVHNDNSITIADWKTGDLLSDFQFNKILKYADELAIKDSKLSKAKFEIFIRALIIKELAPETKFRNLLVTQLNPYAVESYEVEVEEYLNLYTRYLTRENPELLAKLKEKGLLTLSSYIGSSDTLDRKFKELNDKATTRDEKINYVMQKIRSYGYTQSLASLRNSIDYGTSKAFKE